MKYKLDDIDKKQVFKVPEDYFEDLPVKIQQRISNERKNQRSGVPAWSLAFTAAILLLATFIFIIPNGDPTAEDLLAEVSQEDIVAYLDQIDLDEYDIASAFAVEDNEWQFEETDMLEGIDLEDQSMDDVLLEYDLGDEYL